MGDNNGDSGDNQKYHSKDGCDTDLDRFRR
jgi:hypothetical protein